MQPTNPTLTHRTWHWTNSMIFSFKPTYFILHSYIVETLEGKVGQATEYQFCLTTDQWIILT